MDLKVKRGEIWRAYVPYTDAPNVTKRRPVLVLGWSKMGADQDNVVLVVPITSFGEGGQPREGDVEILNVTQCGLNKRSWARSRRLWGADPKVLDAAKGPRGPITNEAMSAILVEIERLFSVV